VTETLKFDLLLIGRALDDVHAMKTIEIACVFGRPAVAPQSLTEIPFMIKDVRIEGVVPDFPVKQFILETLGGEDAIKDYVLMNADASGVA
jgi:hypothetical protein